MLDEGSAKAEPMTDRAARALLFSALMLIQVLAPLATATPQQGPERVLDTDLDPVLLDAFGVKPQGDLAEGWFAPTEAGRVDLAHRTSALVSPSDWADWTSMLGFAP